MKLDDIAKMKDAIDDFLRKENSTLDKYDVFTKKAWLTVGKPEPQASDFVRCLKNMIESFTKTGGWKILYKTK